MSTRTPWPFPVSPSLRAEEGGIPQQDAQAIDALEGAKTSSTGAVLGNPGREHGAYGLIIDAEDRDAAAPSAEERAVRGLAPAAEHPEVGGNDTAPGHPVSSDG